MFPIFYRTIYKTPADYMQPDDGELATNTDYPNLNSRDYAKRPLNHTLRMHAAWECITINEEQHIIIATNKLQGREWTSSLWGFENIDELTPAASIFKLQCNSLISQLKFIAKNIFLMGMNSGKVQVWSTRSEMRNPKNPYCLFLIGEKCEHVKPISCMDVMKSNVNKAVTGSNNGTLKLWDMGSADLFSLNTYRFAHTDVITDVDTSNKDDSIFATCSLDKSALLWDDRLSRPATAIYENHSVHFKALAWSCNSEENTIYLGDESGRIHFVDKRLPNQFLTSLKAFDRPIRKILPNGNKIAVIGDTNSVKIFDATKVEDISTLYENCESQNFVRDAVWSTPSELYTVGFEAKLRTHKLV